MGGGQLDGPGMPAVNDGVTVGMVRLDDAVPAGQQVDLIKIDAEGFEPLIFRGMQAILARSPQATIVTEITIAQWERFGDPLAILDQVRGTRRIYLIGHDGKLTPVEPAGLRARVSSDFVSYILLLPDRADLMGAIRRFL
jgi:hypothetical protein